MALEVREGCAVTMRRKFAIWILLAALGVATAGSLIFVLVPVDVESRINTNQVLTHDPFEIREDARALHSSLTVADWHADTLLWLRDPLEASDVGQVDIPRLAKGNVAIQVFTAVTRVPKGGINLQGNEAEGDRLMLLALGDNWPARVRKSLFERATYQASRLFDAQSRAPERIKVVLDPAGLKEVLDARARGEQVLGALLGTEGLHPLEGKLENVQALFDRGYRVMGLHHFFDNELGGSLHGVSNAGLSQFGREVVAELDRLDIIIDVAHSSVASVDDVLGLTSRPVILSHTGMRGVCDSHRNVPDEVMLRVAKGGGLIGIGYWETAICGTSPGDIVEHIRYAVDLLGLEHVSLGSDYDGSVPMPFDVSELAILTQVMLDRGFGEDEIRAVMGQNMVRFLSEGLPSLP